MILLPRFRARGTTVQVPEAAEGARGGASKKEKLVRGIASAVMAANLIPLAAPFDPAGPMRPTAVMAHDFSPLGMQVRDDVLRVSRNGSVGPADLVTAGVVDAHTSLGNAAIFQDDAKFLADAQHELIFSTYSWVNTDDTRAVFDGLRQLEANRRRDALPGDAPVQVYFLVDDYSKVLQQISSLASSHAFTSHYSSQTEAAREGVKALGIDPAYVQFHFVDFSHTTSGANHAKYTIRDRTSLQMTGANPQFSGGGMAYDLGYVLRGRVAYGAWVDAAKAIHEADASIRMSAEPWQADTYSGEQVPMLLLTRDANSSLIPDYDNPQTVGIVSTLDHAQNRVSMISPNLNSKPILDAINRALARGIKVDILLTKGFNQDKEQLPGQGGSNDQIVTQLRASAAKMGKSDLLDMRWFSWNGEDPAYSHAKDLLADNQVEIEGSGNLDTQSNGYSREANVLIDDEHTVSDHYLNRFLPVFARAIPAS